MDKLAIKQVTIKQVERLLSIDEYYSLDLLDRMSLETSLFTHLKDKALNRALSDRKPIAPALPLEPPLVKTMQVEQGLTVVESIMR